VTPLSPRELLVFTASPVREKPAVAHRRISITEFNLDLALAESSKRKGLRK